MSADWLATIARRITRGVTFERVVWPASRFSASGAAAPGTPAVVLLVMGVAAPALCRRREDVPQASG